MSAKLIVIDDLGTIWSGCNSRLRTAFGSTACNDEFSTYVVKSMGFISVHGYGRSCVRAPFRMPSTLRKFPSWHAYS